MGTFDNFAIGYEYINSPLIHEKCYLTTSFFLLAKSCQKTNFKIQKSSDLKFFQSLEVTPKKNSENCQISILGFVCVAKV
jgi:hypothetical protein